MVASLAADELWAAMHVMLMVFGCDCDSIYCIFEKIYSYAKEVQR
jgi:hypothetical protein